MKSQVEDDSYQGAQTPYRGLESDRREHATKESAEAEQCNFKEQFGKIGSKRMRAIVRDSYPSMRDERAQSARLVVDAVD